MERGVSEQKPSQLLGKWKPLPKRELKVTQPRRGRRTRTISVIIPAHNEEAYLVPTLEALAAPGRKRFETVVVANGCTDNTAGVARGRCDRLIVLSQKNLGVSRNLGARIASGDILVFLDADTLLSPGAIDTIAEDFTEDCAAGTVRGRPDEPALSYKMVYLLKNSVHRWGLHPGSSGVIVCWREHFLQIGGFDEGLEVRENSELMRRLMQFGRYRYLDRAEATTSMRRYQKKGLWRLTWLWTRVWLQSAFGDLHRRRYEIVR